MMKNGVLAIFFLVSSFVMTQSDLYTNIPDTLRAGHHLGGDFDSVDVHFTRHCSTLPGGGIGLQENILPIDFFYANTGGIRFRNFSEWKRMTFSSLPHLGFGYVFGAQGTQYVSTNYQQAFGAKTLLNIHYDAFRNTGFLRNTITNQHDIQLQLQRISNFHSFKFKGNYLRSNYGQSGGIVSDSLIDQFGLLFSPVHKNSAESRYRGTRLVLENYFDVLVNDSLKKLGVYTENQLRILNHRYDENDDLQLAYSVINYDSLQSRDQDQLSELMTNAGAFFESKNIFVKAGIHSNYWRFNNLGNNQSQTEINIDGQLRIKIKRIQLMHHSNFNISGADQEWFTKSHFSTQFSKFSLRANASISSLLPEQFQRSYYGNHVFSTLSSLEKQVKSALDATLNYSIKNSEVGVDVQNITLKNNYFFVANSWRNDSISDLNHFRIGVHGKTGYKILKVSLNANYYIGSYVPDFLIQSRVLIQGRIFRTKKLLAQIGVEGSVHSGYDVLGYLPMLDAYQFTQEGTVISPQAMNLHAFGGFEISQFRFFFRVENIGYFWNDVRNLQMIDYPIPAMNIRLGITWDFFN